MTARRARAALRRARARHHAALPGAARRAARARPAQPVRDRRGALREPVGPRLSRRTTWRSDGAARALSRTCRASRSPPPPTSSRAPTSSSGCSSAERASFVSSFDRPNIRYTHRREGQRARRSCCASSQRRARGRRRHRLLPVAQEGRGDRRLAERARHRRAALSRGLDADVRQRTPGPLPARGRPGDGGDHRLRHGHRQARRALRRPPRPAQEHRELLPGDRSRRPRRRCPPTPGWPTACRTWSTSAA